MNDADTSRKSETPTPDAGTPASGGQPPGDAPGARTRGDSPWSDDPGPGAGKTTGAPADYVPPGGEDVEGGDRDNLDGLRRPRGGTPNVPRP
jgi:hypothetical protein